MSVQKSQIGTKPWHTPCAKCGKQTFVDLLDGEGMCDYCREIKSMKVSAMRSKKAREEKK